MFLEAVNQEAALHAPPLRVPRITSWPEMVSWASVRLASTTSVTAILQIGPSFFPSCALGVGAGELFDEAIYLPGRGGKRQ